MLKESVDPVTAISKFRVTLKNAKSFTEPISRGSKTWKLNQSEDINGCHIKYYKENSEFVVNELKIPLRVKVLDDKIPEYFYSQVELKMMSKEELQNILDKEEYRSINGKGLRKTEAIKAILDFQSLFNQDKGEIDDYSSGNSSLSPV